MSLIFRLVSRLSLKTQYRLARFFGFFIRLIPNRTSSYTRLNIALCFPQMASEEKQQLVKLSIQHSSYSLFELAAVWCAPAEKILHTVNSQDICTSFRQSHQGSIIIAPHLGCWELMILWLAQRPDFMCLYKPQENATFDQFILEARSRNGAEMLPTNKAGLRQMSRGLKQGKTVMILPDQRPGKSGTEITVDFFGHSASSSPLIHKLCRSTNCDIFIAAMIRSQDLGRFNLCIEALDRNSLSGDQQQSLLYLNKQMECLIKKHPEQYQWGYRRFPAELYRQQQIN
ncbi:MAG: lysophospholipid acyltransferase family protein [Gammaproteobacteria bacterium]|nr:lysophospholipid acyltransferase family protein [Gammaproteobacteria bacterium]